MFDADTDLEKNSAALLGLTAEWTLSITQFEKRFTAGNAEKYEIGERVVTGQPIYDGMEMLLSTDEECIVRQVTLSSIMCPDSGKEYNTYMLSLEPIYDSNVKTVHCHVLHESSFLRV